MRVGGIWVSRALSINTSRTESCGLSSERQTWPLIHAFLDLVEVAVRYNALTDRYLQIWGELGELFVEVKYGLKRHRVHAAGSDGRIGDDFVEVKTLSPGKGCDSVMSSAQATSARCFW